MLGGNGVKPNVVPVPTAQPSSSVVTSNQTDTQNAVSATPWFLAGLLALFVIWGAIEQHKTVRESVAPSNIAINARNLGVLALSVILVANLLKIAAAKSVAWKLPFAKTFAHLVGAI